MSKIEQNVESVLKIEQNVESVSKIEQNVGQVINRHDIRNFTR